MANKKGFIMYADLLENIESLSMEQRGVLFTSVLCSQSEKELPEMDGAVKIAFSFIKKSIDIRTQKYNEIVEKRRESGRKGGRPPKEENQIKPNESKKNQIKPNESNTKAKKPDIGERITDNGKRITDNGDKQEREEKERVSLSHKYGEYKNVLLTDEELKKLKEEAPESYLEKLEALSVYMKSTGKSYKSHYATIRAWIRKDQKKEDQKKEGERVESEDKGRVFNCEEFL